VERGACGFQPSVDRTTLQERATGRFTAHGQHGVFPGPPGTGHTPLAIGLGVNAVQPGHRTLVTSAMRLVATLPKADAESRLEARLTPSGRPKLLSMAESGSSPLDPHGAHLCFQRISRRSERGAIILTANQSVGPWAEALGTPSLAPASLERWLQHSVVLTIQGAS